MKSQIKQALYWLLSQTWLRQGANRRILFGPYRNLYIHLSPPLRQRLRIFFRSYEPEVTRWLRENIQPGMTVYNVGAHAGVHALYVAQLLDGQGRVYAFEGWPENYEALKANFTVNRALNVEMIPVQLCVAAQSGTVMMAVGKADGKQHIAVVEEADSIPVTATSLDDFVSAHVGDPDLIVMDIEGHELDALHGGRELIERRKPLLLIEHHERIEPLSQWLEAHRYQVEPLGRRHLVAR